MKRNSRGFSLIEVLVTIVLTTVGILGMVALQSKSIQYTQDSVNRNNAIALTSDLVEIMRANRDVLFTKGPPKEPIYSQLAVSSDFYTTVGSLNFVVGDCAKPAQTAKQQAGCWLEKAQALLPDATNTEIAGSFMVCPSYQIDTDGKPVCADSSFKGSSMAIQLAWRGKEKVCGPNSNSDICTFTTRVEL